MVIYVYSMIAEIVNHESLTCTNMLKYIQLDNSVLPNTINEINPFLFDQ